MKCIYNGKEEDQATFEKREHVFPAGIGGINMLDQGDVSDEINEFFSKLELKFMRESIIQIPRILLGPGKRGSLNKKKATKSKILLIGNEGNERIGYIELGVPKVITQIKFLKENMKINLITQSVDENMKLFLRFENSLKKGEKIKVKKTKRLDLNTSIVGFNHDKTEEFIYIYHNCEKFSLSELIKCFENKKIFEKIRNFFIKENLITSSEENIQFSNEINFNINEYFRVCCKIALNGLCFLEGRDYIEKNKFIEIKNFILNGGENNFAKILEVEKNKEIENYLKKIQIPKHSHFMIFFEINEEIYCTLRIYGILHEIHLGKKIDGAKIFNGLICDWQNRKEYFLDEYIIEKLNDKKFYEEYVL